MDLRTARPGNQCGNQRHKCALFGHTYNLGTLFVLISTATNWRLLALADGAAYAATVQEDYNLAHLALHGTMAARRQLERASHGTATAGNRTHNPRAPKYPRFLNYRTRTTIAQLGRHRTAASQAGMNVLAVSPAERHAVFVRPSLSAFWLSFMPRQAPMWVTRTLRVNKDCNGRWKVPRAPGDPVDVPYTTESDAPRGNRAGCSVAQSSITAAHGPYITESGVYGWVNRRPWKGKNKIHIGQIMHRGGIEPVQLVALIQIWLVFHS
ncbi:hypothetical protein B0H17DRAFT_1151012 [Mycena rosella]|uniref:Uncharacterized protein n=1 Tax=Mycena rosella TaxID=1033263 RepID=A0AAD7BNW4_MYCRO|nr:hypothetical protein B0H17DRAFT_1151012 [Mycena rosella]